MSTVRLGEAETAILVGLRPPNSVATAYDVVGAGATNPMRAFCAALGVCWNASDVKRDVEHVDDEDERAALAKRPVAHRLTKPPVAKYTFEPLAYGGDVFDALVGRGYRPAQVHAAGVVAMNLLVELLPGGDEVDEAEDFSEPAPGDSTS